MLHGLPSPSTLHLYEPTKHNCGYCHACRANRAKQIKLQIMHEAAFHEDNCVITFTYNDEHLPENGSLSSRDMTLMTKRLRKVLKKNFDKKIRFKYIGEYGTQGTRRAHYHYILFGHDFIEDRVLYSSSNGTKLFKSPTLDKVWSINNSPIGNALIGEFSEATAGYVAGYITSKPTGKLAKSLNEIIDKTTGEVFTRKNVFTAQSNRPGIGEQFYKKYLDNIYATDSVIDNNGNECLPPKYSDEILKRSNPDLYESVKKARIKRAESKPPLTALRQSQLAKFNKIKYDRKNKREGK